MLNFSRSESGEDSSHLVRIQTLSSKIDQKIAQKSQGKDTFIETLSIEELKDLRQVIMAAEYLLSKYQDKKELKAFLEEFIGVILHAANSVNTMRDDLSDLVISAEVAYQQIQTLHEEITHNLTMSKILQTKLDDFSELQIPTKPKVEVITPPSPINLTNSARRIYTHDYLTKTAVEI